MRSVMIEANRRNGETIIAMGMAGSLAQRWAGVNNRYIAAGARLSDVAGSYGSVSKVLRLLLQSMILGLGAYLVIRQELTAGAMIAASIMMGRALAPIETRTGAPSSQPAKASGGYPTRSRGVRQSELLPPCPSLHVVSSLSKPRSPRRGLGRRSSQGCTSALNQAKRWASWVRAAPARARWGACWSASGGRPEAASDLMVPRSISGTRNFSAGTWGLFRRRSSYSMEQSRRTSRE